MFKFGETAWLLQTLCIGKLQVSNDLQELMFEATDYTLLRQKCKFQNLKFTYTKFRL